MDVKAFSRVSGPRGKRNTLSDFLTLLNTVFYIILPFFSSLIVWYGGNKCCSWDAWTSLGPCLETTARNLDGQNKSGKDKIIN